MAVHYILDGYNIIQQNSDLMRGSLLDGRRRLIRWIEIRRPQGSVRNRVTIVFDGKPNVLHAPINSLVHIIFTQGGSADDRIKQLVQKAQNKKNQIVVTDDRDIRHHVRALGAEIMAVEEFLARMSPPKPQQDKPGANRSKRGSGKDISRILEHEINREMKGIWLKHRN